VSKKELRRQFRELLARSSPEELRVRGAQAAERLFAEAEYRAARTLMIFLATPRELDTAEIARRAWLDGKRVVAPRIDWENCGLTPVEISSLDAELIESRHGICEPTGQALVGLKEIGLVIVPGLAFDLSGNRLGRGRGFYDRFLAQPDFRGTACGFGTEEQVIPRLPVEALDVPVQMLVTDVQVRRFSS
jgi:5-formyltetrahydrofolate cyclo-ligase